DGWVEFTSPGGKVADFHLLPVAILTMAGVNITPAGLKWKLRKRGGSWRLVLRLDDRKLQVPYVIDPSLAAGSGPAQVVAGELGSPQASAAVTKGETSINSSGVSVGDNGGSVSLSSRDAGSGGWTGFANGNSRSTGFGEDSVVVSGKTTEEFLTVQTRQGNHTWVWHLTVAGVPPTLN